MPALLLFGVIVWYSIEVAPVGGFKIQILIINKEINHVKIIKLYFRDKRRDEAC